MSEELKPCPFDAAKYIRENLCWSHASNLTELPKMHLMQLLWEVERKYNDLQNRRAPSEALKVVEELRKWHCKRSHHQECNLSKTLNAIEAELKGESNAD